MMVIKVNDDSYAIKLRKGLTMKKRKVSKPLSTKKLRAVWVKLYRQERNTRAEYMAYNAYVFSYQNGRR